MANPSKNLNFLNRNKLNITQKLQKLSEAGLEIQGHLGSLNCICISPVSPIVATGACDSKIRIWDILSLKLLHTFEGHTSRVNNLVFTKNSEFLISCSGYTSGRGEKCIKVWDFYAKSLLSTLNGHSDKINAIGLTKDNTQLISGSDDCKLIFWDLRSSSILYTHISDSGGILSLVCTYSHTIFTSSNPIISFFNISTKTLDHTIVQTQLTKSIIANYAEKLALWTQDNTILVWDIEKNQVKTKLAGHTSNICALAITENEDKAISLSNISVMIIWDLISMEMLREVQLDLGCQSLACTIDGNFIITGSIYRFLRLMKNEIHTEALKFQGHIFEVTCFALSQDGKMLASGSRDCSIRLWSIDTGKQIAVLEGHYQMVTCLHIISDKGYLLSAGRDSKLLLWDLKTQEIVFSSDAHPATINWMVCNNVYAFYGDERNNVYVLEIEKRSEKIIFCLEGTSKLCGMELSKEMKYILCSFNDGRYRVIDVKSFRG